MSRSRPRSRLRIYVLVRVVAGITFLVGAVVLPHGVPAALVVVAAGVAAVLSSLWSMAGGPGERAGARQQDRYFDSVSPPQGDWPPYVPGPDQAPPVEQGAVRPAPARDDPR